MKAALAILLFAALVTQAQTNPVIYETVVITNWFEAPPNLRRFGNEVYDVPKARRSYVSVDPATGAKVIVHNFDYLQGKVSSVQDGLILLDIEKYIPGPVLPASGNGAIGGYTASAKYAPGHWEYDKTVAVTNYPEIKTATINQEIRIVAKSSGVVHVNGNPLEFYDYGRPWIYQIVSTNRIALKQSPSKKLK